MKENGFAEWMVYGVFTPVRPKRLRLGLTLEAYALNIWLAYRAAKGK